MQEQKTINDAYESIKKIMQNLKNIDDLSSHYSENLVKIKTLANDTKTLLTNLRTEKFFKAISKNIESIEEKIVKWEEQLKQSFGNVLETLLREKKQFELTGQYPLLKAGFYTFEVMLDNLEVVIWYGPKFEKLEVCTMDPESVVQKLISHHEKIVGRSFDQDVFINKIFEIYQKKKTEETSKMPLYEILGEYVMSLQDKKFKANPIKSNFAEYSRVFFSYDLYRLKKREIEKDCKRYKLNLITATRDFTASPYDHIWVPFDEKGNGSHVSHLEFMSF